MVGVGVKSRAETSALFISPFLARKRPQHWAATMKGMNSGQR